MLIPLRVVRLGQELQDGTNLFRVRGFPSVVGTRIRVATTTTLRRRHLRVGILQNAGHKRFRRLNGNLGQCTLLLRQRLAGSTAGGVLMCNESREDGLEVDLRLYGRLFGYLGIRNVILIFQADFRRDMRLLGHGVDLQCSVPDFGFLSRTLTEQNALRARGVNRTDILNLGLIHDRHQNSVVLCGRQYDYGKRSDRTNVRARHQYVVLELYRYRRFTRYNHGVRGIVQRLGSPAGALVVHDRRKQFN